MYKSKIMKYYKTQVKVRHDLMLCLHLMPYHGGLSASLRMSIMDAVRPPKQGVYMSYELHLDLQEGLDELRNN